MRTRKTIFVVVRILICIFVLVASTGLIQQTYAQDTKRPYDGQPALSPDGKKIAFISNREGRADLWVMDADGTNPINLTSTVDIDAFSPQWSPNNQEILFMALTKNTGDIWIASLINKTVQNLTLDQNNRVVSPNWSPDGKFITYVEVVDDISNKTDIWVMDSTGSNRRQIVSGGFFFIPKWSPDGKSIAFLSSFETTSTLELIEIKTGKIRILSQNNPFDYSWAPRSNLIVYATQQLNNLIYYSDVWLIQTDTAAEFKLTDEPTPLATVVDVNLLWSPDQENILFVSPCGDNNTDIKMLILKEKSIVNITTCQEGHNFDPNWFPDSEHILLQSNRSGRISVWVMSKDGKKAIDLINRAN